MCKGKSNAVTGKPLDLYRLCSKCYEWMQYPVGSLLSLREHDRGMIGMKKTIFLLLLISAAFSAAFGEDKALLYEVSGNGLSQPSYIYGTFHLVCPDDLRITDRMRKAMDEAKQLYLELDFDDPNLQENMVKQMLLADGKTLKDILKPQDYTTLDTYLKSQAPIGLAQLGTLRPIALFSVMSVTLIKCQPASYDLTLAQIASRDRKEVLGLETVETQIAAFDKMPLDEQLKSLVDIARRPDEARKEMQSLAAAYEQEDLDLLIKLIRESKFDSESQTFEDEILNKRNSNWIPVIEKAAHGKPTFFAFGAGHLIGTGGVLSLLRQKGYTVKPLH
jgi:uncharacterized protein